MQRRVRYSDQRFPEAVRSLKLSGYWVQPDYLNILECENLISAVERLFEDNSESLWIDALGADRRLYGVDKISSKLDPFKRNPVVDDIVRACVFNRDYDSFVLAGHISSGEKNLGSGGGWHRDSVFRNQFKVLLYLSDTTDANGPFQYVKHSHLFSYDDTIRSLGLNLDYSSRFSDESLNRIVEISPLEVVSFEAKAGTAIVVNTRGIHRGKPLSAGERYALTKYIWTSSMPKHIERTLPKSSSKN